MTIQVKHLLQRCLIAISIATILPACSALTEKKDERSGVSVRSLNYSGREVVLGVEDPVNPKNQGGGEALNPYGGGGNMCCFSIPEKWHPDLKVIVDAQFYPEKEHHKQLVSVPPYANGEAGEIWIMMHEDGSAEAVVSNYGPSRTEWPGKIKGYPVPSRGYRLKLFDEKISREKAARIAFEKALQKPNKTAEQLRSYQEEIEDINKNIERLERSGP